MENQILPNVLITGASAGIGRASALRLAPYVAEFFLVARRAEKLVSLKSELLNLNPKLKCHLIVMDVNDPKLLPEIEKVSQRKIDVLINNAGLALGKDTVQEGVFLEFAQMIDTNITANFKIIHGVLPWMIQNGRGDILNLCSIAGHETYPGGAIYCATKHAVHAFTKVLREETAGKNIRVMQISPGMVDTEFSNVRFKGDATLAKNVYANMKPLQDSDIARMIHFMLEQPRHVVIDEIITMPMQQGSVHTVVRNS